MSPSEHHQHVVQQYFEDVYNRRHDLLLHDLFHPEFTDYSQHPDQGPALAQHMVDFERSVFPDIHLTVADMVASDDVVVRVKVQGTHGDTFLGITPTGHHVEFLAAQRMRFQDGKVVQIVWHLYEKLKMLHQLGAIDLPAHVAGT